MGTEQILFFVNLILGIAYRLWEKADQIKTKAIPTWEQISDKNAILQAEIDKEKEM